MAQNIFDVTNDQNNVVHVNGYDWSHQCNFTGRLGYIYPIFTDLVPAKSSFRVSPKLGLQFMPMVFPVQTRMKARVSFFRMPLRALWKDYKDFVGNFRQGLEEPYLDLATSFEKFMGTQKLADYLDVPTVLYGKYGSYIEATLPKTISSPANNFRACFYVDGAYSNLATGAKYQVYGSGQPSGVTSFAGIYYAAPLEFIGGVPTGITVALSESDLLRNLVLQYGKSLSGSQNFVYQFYVACLDSENKVLASQPITDIIDSFIGITENGTWKMGVGLGTQLLQDVSVTFPVATATVQLVMLCKPSSVSVPTVWYPIAAYYSAYAGTDGYEASTIRFGQDPVEGGYIEIDRDNSPYYDSSSKNKDRQLKLSAYAPRAYEAIYNAYLRDNRNNPYYRNGQVEYNVWIPTDEGGADKTVYELHRANWEKDFLTTAVPSPQQGRAPLVGITTYTDSQTVDGITTTALKMALVDENGKRYAVNMKTNDEGVQGVEYAELPEGTSMSPLSYRSLVDAATTGISIPDLRMVNAYQKFLELNMRKGYSYKQIVEGRFDCQVRYDDLNMPEFIGGFTRDVNMNRVVQSVERNATEDYPEGSYANALGSLAGDAFLAADGPSISCFCDEESIIMGIISIVPVPNYSQLLPKHFLYRDLLDHFQPEFNSLGFQPITYKEVCPIQAFNAGDNLDDVFGYQRPWYEYVQKTDKVHGLFRTQLRNFLMNRVFDVKPTLTKSFLLVDDEQLNDVFAVTDTTDKIIGQIWLDCSVKLPINRVAIPRLD